MPVLAVSLILAAAALHASWNLLVKGSRTGLAFFSVTLLASVVLWSPAFVVLLMQNPIPPDGWPWIVATGILHAFYFWSLATAYQRADISVAYPIARGLGPALVLLVSLSVLREPVTALGVIGVLAVVVGIYQINLRGFDLRTWRAPLAALVKPEGRYAALTGVIIATYTLVDKQGVSRVHPLVYVYLMFALSLAGVAPVALRHHRLQLGQTVRAQWQRVGTVAVLWVGAYLLILFALQIAPAPYVAAAREVSIVFAAVLGMTVLGERKSLQRFAGVIWIATGVILIGFA